MMGSESLKSCTPSRDSLRRGPKVGPKGSEGGPKVFGRRPKSCTPHRDSLRRGSEGGSDRKGPKGVRQSWDSIGEGLGCGYESMYTVVRMKRGGNPKLFLPG